MKPIKILFANVPIDGHFNPLTALAVYMKQQGHDVRWYAGKAFTKKLEKLGIPQFPFEKAAEINQFNIDLFYPERTKLKSGIPKLKFDLKNFFVYRAAEYFEDIKKVYESFPFELLICDAAFTASPLVKKKLNVPVVAIGIVPLMQTSKDLGPYGMGFIPETSFISRLKQDILRLVAKNVIFKESVKEFNKVMTSYGLPGYDEVLFDIPLKEANVYLQSGVPGFEYKRSDLGKNIKFVGAMRPHKSSDKNNEEISWLPKLKGKKVMLVSQGTFEPDHSKLIHPTLDAFKNSDYMLLVATGYHHTEALKQKYKQDNIIIEDFMNFDIIMPLCDVYVTNGGYGGVLLSIEHGLPMVCGGIDEGKSEICSRVGYFNIGIDLKTETPPPDKIKVAVEKVLTDSTYKNNVVKLRDEFSKYDTLALSEKYIEEVMTK